jgi:hypothetical protein
MKEELLEYEESMILEWMLVKMEWMKWVFSVPSLMVSGWIH